MQAPASLTGVPPIPAMTTDAERECYYRLVREGAGKGAIVELGAWLGASTAYIAAALRDAGVPDQVRVYDKFESQAAHARKVSKFYAKHGMPNVPMGPCLEDFKRHLGPLLAHVEVHQGQIEKMAWGDAPIAVLISDAPKRVPAISPVLTTLRKAMGPGSVMAWQDFCHFPSYEIPMCLYRLRRHIEFVEAVVPGTTLVFRVTSSWEASEVSFEALGGWRTEEVLRAWTYWLDFVPEEKRLLFRCGAALFVCDLGDAGLGVDLLRDIVDTDAEAVMPKWKYLHDGRLDLVKRYRPLFDFLAERGLL